MVHVHPLRRLSFVHRILRVLALLAVIFITAVSIQLALWAFQAKADFTADFNAIVMPKDFQFLSETFGHNGRFGGVSLTRTYRTHGSRREISAELIPIVEGQRWTLETAGYPASDHYYFATAITDRHRGRNDQLTVEFYPKYPSDVVTASPKDLSDRFVTTVQVQIE